MSATELEELRGQTKWYSAKNNELKLAHDKMVATTDEAVKIRDKLTEENASLKVHL